MKNKKFLAMILALTMVVAIAGCGAKTDKNETGAKENSTKVESSVDKKDDVEKDNKDESEVEVSGDVSENEIVTEETQKTDNKKDDTTTNTETNNNNTTTNKNESTSNKNETTTKPSSGNTDSNKKPNTGNNNTTTKPSTGSTGNSASTNNSGSTGNTQNNNTSTTTQPSTPVHEHKWTEVVENEIHYYAWRTICNVCNADLTDMEEDEWAYHVVVICGGSYATYYKEVDFVTENVVKTPVVTGYKCECGATKGK